ncbi:protein kinase domain-containing protein [Cellulosimicrobium composti]|uniref:Protein kinase n=1 Tax=Cellulosimicrobium composti TaxID=2672572 RepID=A0ABX0B6X7_9MICO|nr:protein kinase [Cellulosimicrobium composti]NDO88497.1 protein kinase [Cellulosimicrobium composti]
MGEYVGPGERKTAERLAADLPDPWVIYVGRKLAGSNKDDVDFIVVGQKFIFTLEEKHWGPTIIVDDVYWHVKGDRRHSPVSQIAAVSRKLAGLLKDKVDGYKSLKGKRVLAGVVLSYDGVKVLSGRNFDQSERVWTLPYAAEEMVALEQREPTTLGATRPVLLQYLDGLSPAEKRDRIGDYKVIGQIPAAGNEKAFEARAPITGESVILKCYPVEQLKQLGDPREYLLREYKAINAVADLGRTWRALQPFESAPHGFFVVPVIPPANSWTLWRDVQSLTTPRDGRLIGVEDATRVVRSAFEALKDVHEAGLVHRALHPQRIWLSKNRLVKFSDFHLAKLTGQQTIYTWADYDISEGYRAPEAASDVGLATAPSDVFSLVLSLSAWLLGTDVTDMKLDDVRTALTGIYPWSEGLITGLDGAASNRPTAGEMAEKIALPASPPPPPPTADSLEDFRVGGVVRGRYEIRASLGSGGFARTWEVYDRNAELTRVLKQFHELVPEHVRAEFKAADELVHEKCGRVYDIQLAQAPAYLVSEYVEGESLAEPGIDRSVAEIRTTALDVLDALEYIHGKERVHGDVTPSNIIEKSNGSAKLIDFGLSSAIGLRPTGWNPMFAAPEVRRDGRVSPAADIFGFAASMAYAMLGRHPITVDGDQVRSLPPTEDERDAWGEEGALLLDVFFKGLAEQPSERPESAGAFRALVNGARLVRGGRSLGTDRDEAGEGEPGVQFVLAPQINPSVTAIRRLYRAATGGNAGNRGLDDAFANQTYVATLLDVRLVPRVLAKEFDVVLLSGNPGDGKTSVLVKLGEELRARGAQDIDSDEAGWTLELEGHRFYAIFDASESHGDMSSDELVNRALLPVLEGEPATALLAVNDGRLNQFFIDNSDLYEHWWFSIEDQMNGKPYDGSGAVLIDLKRRTLADTGSGDGLGPRVLGTIVADPLWEICGSCSAQTSCPILANRNLLANEGAAAFGELLQISHLRRRRRATFRDVRSAISWLITGNMTCHDVHRSITDGQNPLYRETSATFDLAFSEDSGDYLVQEWASLDPSSVPAPAVDRAFRAMKDDSRLDYVSSPEHLARAIYFRLDAVVPGDDIDAGGLRTFRYFDEFMAMLRDGGSTKARDRILLGISRLAGAFGYAEPGLAMSSGADGTTWAVLHTVPEDEFHVEVPTVDGEFVETMPDQLLLRHDKGASLNLTLDTAEIILRAADGEIVNDVGADATRQEIDSFVNQLKRRPSQSAQIVDSSGSVTVARIRSGAIEMEPAQ